MGDANDPKGEVTTPEGKEEQTPQAQTLTKEEHERAIAKAKSDTMADYKRLETELKRSQSIAEAAVKRLQKIEEDNYRREEEAVRDNPDELTRIRKRRQDAEREAQLAEKEAKLNAQYTRILQTTARSLEAQYNVSAETLLEYAGEDAEKMEKLAKSFGERKGESTTTRMTEKPDDGKTKGASKGLTLEDIKKMSAEEINQRYKEIAKIPFAT